MQRQPAQLPVEEYPGVRSRFDDFVAYVLLEATYGFTLNAIA